MNEKNVMKAFDMFVNLSTNGSVKKEDYPEYMDDEIRSIITAFVNKVDATTILAGDYIYLIPLSTNSDFHMSNQSIKEKYLPSSAKNIDIYMLYFSVLIFIGEFYDSYTVNKATRDFLSLANWYKSIDERIKALEGIGIEKLLELEKDYEYNWTEIINKWNSMDAINESITKQSSRTKSRLGFLFNVKNFLIEENLAEHIGNDEFILTDKAKVIVQRFFMDDEYNRGILDIIYNYNVESNIENNLEDK